MNTKIVTVVVVAIVLTVVSTSIAQAQTSDLDTVAFLISVTNGLTTQVAELEMVYTELLSNATRQVTGLEAELEELRANSTRQITGLEAELEELRANSTRHAGTAINDSGDFIPIYYSATDPYYISLKQDFQDRTFLENFTVPLTQTLALPYDIYLTMDECVDDSSHYHISSHTIVICYEDIEFYEYILYPYYDTYDELYQAVDEAFTWIVLHELGHALVDAYDLPITGKEEDAVDQFATVIVLEYIPLDQTGSNPYPTLFSYDALDALDTYYTTNQLAGVHSLDAQRMYNVACWMYGSNPSLYENLIIFDVLPPSRAVTCVEEYNLMSKSWYRLVSPFLINQGSVPPPSSISP